MTRPARFSSCRSVRNGTRRRRSVPCATGGPCSTASAATTRRTTSRSRPGLNAHDPELLLAIASLGSFDVVVNGEADSDGALRRYVSSIPGVTVIATDGTRTVYQIPATVRPDVQLGPVLPIVSAWANSQDASLAVDGRIETEWNDGRSQQPGQWLVVDLGQTREVAGITHALGEYARDFPRRLAIDLSLDGSVWLPAWQGRTLVDAFLAATRAPIEAPVRVAFEPRQARFVRLRQLDTEIHLWRIAELRVHTAGLMADNSDKSTSALTSRSHGWQHRRRCGHAKDQTVAAVHARDRGVEHHLDAVRADLWRLRHFASRHQGAIARLVRPRDRRRRIALGVRPAAARLVARVPSSPAARSRRPPFAGCEHPTTCCSSRFWSSRPSRGFGRWASACPIQRPGLTKKPWGPWPAATTTATSSRPSSPIRLSSLSWSPARCGSCFATCHRRFRG